MAEYTVEFVGTGETVEVSDKETILSACIDAGIAQEYSCRVGMCLACMARPQSDLKLDRGKYPPSIEDAAADGQAAAGADD